MSTLAGRAGNVPSGDGAGALSKGMSGEAAAETAFFSIPSFERAARAPFERVAFCSEPLEAAKVRFLASRVTSSRLRFAFFIQSASFSRHLFLFYPLFS